MSAGNILCLNQPMGVRLIRILYCIALVLIAIMVVSGIVGGVRTMMRPAPQAQAAMATPDAGSPAAPAPQPPQAMNPGRPDFGPGNFRRRFGRPGMRGPMMDGRMMRGPFIMGVRLSPPLFGALRILFALFRGLIAVMVIRVLAEIGTAILTMAPRQTS